MSESEKLYNFILYLTLCSVLVLTSFIILNNLKSFYAYGVEARSLFFGREFNITSNIGTSQSPQIAAQGNNVYVVWQDNTTGNYDIYFTYSSDNGNKFAPVVNLSNNNGTSELPQIAAQGNNVYVVWQDNTTGNYDILVKPSISNGSKFKHVRNLSNNNGTSELPQIAAQGNNVYVVWQDNTTGNYDIYLKRSPNAGTGFKGVNFVRTNGTSQSPQIAAQGNNVYVVWQDNTTGNYDIFFQPILQNGTKFKYVRNLSNNNGTSVLPHIAVSSNDAYAIWIDDESGTNRVFFRHAEKDDVTGLINFSFVNKLFHNGNASQAKILTGSHAFYGVWNTQLNKYNASAIEFYPFMLFEDYSGDSIALTSLSSSEVLSEPDIAVQNGDIYLVWVNKSLGNGDVFFKRLGINFFEQYR